MSRGRQRTLALIAPAALALAVGSGLAAQQTCVPVYGTPFEAVVSARGLASTGGGTGLLQTGSTAVATRGCPDSLSVETDPAFAILPVSVQSTYRSAYPFDRNNGVLWSGRGYSQGTSLGARFAAGPLRVTLYPTVAFQQNRDFTLAPSGFSGSPLRYPLLSIDWPQRPESAPYWTIHPGQTSVRLRLGPVELSGGTENLWWGPADRYPILLSSTGAGFLHARMGVQPLDIGIGTIELGLIWGKLDESNHFDAETSNDDRLLTVFTAGYRPSFAPGLTMGAALARHADWSGWASAAGEAFVIDRAENQQGNGLMSATAEWRFPTVDLRIYGEWAREDRWLDFEDLVTELDHGQAYLLGLEKVQPMGDRSWRARWELVHLGEANTQSSRSRPSFYTHSLLTQGHTHQGQLLGAAVGPGSNAQFLAIDLLSRSNVIGGYVERIRRSDDLYEATFAPNYGFRGHDVELTAGAYGLEGIGPVTLQWDVGVSRRKNRTFIGLDGVSWDFFRETNLGVSLTAWWAPQQ